MQLPRPWADRRYLAWGGGGLAIAVVVAAALVHTPPTPPRVVPGAPGAVLAQVAAPDPEEAALRARASAGDRGAAVRLAYRYVERGRAAADPRYHGRAEAVLAPWWDTPSPPQDVLLVRATIRQAVHDFAGARADLDALLRRDPEDPNARLTRAAVAGVTGDLATATADCAGLAGAGAVIELACAAPQARAGGDLAATFTALTAAVAAAGPGAPSAPDVERWARTALGELARWRGDDAAAERAFRAALAVDPASVYTQTQLADLLLDAHRDRDAAELLRGAGEADGLLLRLAIAEHRLGDPAARAHAKVVRARLLAGMARGDLTHQREYALYLLELADDPASAVRAATTNWALQKESIDAQLVLRAAAAAGDRDAAAPVLAWNAAHHVTDALVARAAAGLGGAP